MRDISVAMLAALADGTVRPALFFHGQFASGHLRLWSGLGEVVALGATWTGAGNLLGFGSVEENAQVAAAGTTVALSGVPLTVVQLVIDDLRQGYPGRLYIGMLDEDGALVSDPALLFDGRIDMAEIADDAETCTITVTLENRLIDLQRPRSFRYTHESQQVLFPGDMAFEHVTAIQDMDFIWGRK